MTPTRSPASGSMRAVRWNGPGDVAAVDVARPSAADGWALVDVAFTGLCGTDLHICAGEHPRAVPGLVLGHEISGVLAHDVPGIAAGTAVVVDPLLSCGGCGPCTSGRPHTCARLRLVGIDVAGGAAEQVAVPVTGLVPVGTPAGRGAAGSDADLAALAFAEPLGVAVRAVRRSGLVIGEDAVVVGAGPVGLAVALCARLAGAGSVTVVETSERRRGFAAGLGLDVAGSLDGVQAPVVFDCASHPAVAARLCEATAATGRIVLVGVYPGVTGLDLQAVTFKELQVIGTRVYSRDDLRTATRMIVDGLVDPSPLLTRTVSVDEAPAAIAALPGGHDVKVLVRGRG